MRTYLSTADLGTIATALSMAAILVMQWWMNQKSNKRDVRVAEIKAIGQTTAEKVEATAKQVDAVHTLTNGGLGEQLQIAKVSAETLANVTHKQEHIALANIAREKYEAHMQSIQDLKVNTMKAESEA